jgi:hypothetical protein
MINVPTSQNNGIYSLVTSSGTYSYTVSSSSRDVTFTKTNTGYTVSNNVINLQIPFEKRYLIRSGSTYYTVVDNALSELSITELTSSAFLNFGTEVAPQYYLLADLTSPEILYWVDKDSGIPTNGLIVTGDPTLPQVIYYNNQNIPSEQCIDSVEVFSKSVLFAVSFDNGQTWKYHNGTSWLDAASVSEGMDGDNIKNITRAQWSEVTSSDSLKFRASLTALDSHASHKVYFNFAPLQ